MKWILLIILLYACTGFSTTTSDSFVVKGIIPVKINVIITQVSDLTYIIHEISNNPNGYTTILNIDGKITKFTEIKKQIESINIYKELNLLIKPNNISVSIYAN